MQVEKFIIADYLNTPVAFGSELGKSVFKQLSQQIKPINDQQVIHISMEGVEAVDSTFVRDSILALAKLHRGKKAYIISGFKDNKISSNWQYAARALGQPFLALIDDEYSWVDACLIKAQYKNILQFAHDKKIVTSQEIADRFDMSLQAASGALKSLFDQGFLLRYSSLSTNSRSEYKYKAIEL